jgi:hypothetical protein
MRRAFSLLGSALLVAALASPVSAGGWASVTADDPAAQPTAGSPMTVGFTVLQHGVTPRDDLQPRLVATDAVTGQVREFVATSDGSNGHYSVPVRFDDAGFWTWRVDLRELESDGSGSFTVRGADGAAPALDFPTVAAVSSGSIRRMS